MVPSLVVRPPLAWKVATSPPHRMNGISKALLSGSGATSWTLTWPTFLLKDSTWPQAAGAAAHSSARQTAASRFDVINIPSRVIPGQARAPPPEGGRRGGTGELRALLSLQVR